MRLQVISILPALGENFATDCKCESGIGADSNLPMFIGEAGGLIAVGIDVQDLCAPFSSGFENRGEV